MLKQIFAFSVLIFATHMASAQTCVEIFQAHSSSEALAEFYSLVTPTAKASFVAEVARRINDKYELSLEEYLEIANWGAGQNFYESSVVDKIQAYAKNQPLTPAQLDQVLQKYPGDNSIIGRLSSTLNDKSLMARKPILEINFTGNATDFVNVLLKNYRLLSKKQGIEFITTVFHSVFRENVATFHLGSTEIKNILDVLPVRSLSVETLTDLRYAIGLEALAKLDGNFLLSRFDLSSANEEVLELLLTYNVNYLNKLKDQSQFPHLPGDLLADAYLAKKTAVERLGATGESLARDIFAKSASLMINPHLGDRLKLYEVAQSVAELILAGQLRSDVTEAFIEAVYDFQNSRLIYDYEFSPQVAQHFLLQELPTLGEVDAVRLKDFFAKFMNVYKFDDVSGKYGKLYIYPHSLVTSAAIQAAVDLYKIEILFGPVGEGSIELYFDLRLGNVYPLVPNLVQTVFHKTMEPMDHEDALNYVRTHLNEPYSRIPTKD